MNQEGNFLKQYLKKERLSAIDLADKLGLTKQAVYAQLSKTDISVSFKEKLESIGINIFKGQSKVNSAIPYYDVDASAGSAEVFNDKIETPSAMVSFPGFQDCDFWINVFGDSMYPKYCSGEIVACKKIEKSLVPFGEAFLIRLRDGNRYIKFIRKNHTKEQWTLTSENDKYDPFDVGVDDITDLWIIKGKLKRNLI